ncbi:high molecular weight rhoptry protein 3, putative [Plasmodium relictum]|uniref:High molecular weight rhoptry protein 3, putative n=1 Tax=Plasmodium relictum TaxID=85471 RepID=A0A1J1H307_PLARL|nr:high molecular weight rhoptry protein 3, putative [Plasmodium relictum]CRG99261.1 high molecular weight rhoptry protein 3, putative [Plasmodium relictum]
MKSKIFATLFVTWSSVLVTGREHFNGYLTQKLKILLECNFIAHYYLKGVPEIDSFLDFIREPEQFYWFVEHYLSVPFKITQNLKDRTKNGKIGSVNNISVCSGRSWVSEFLLNYKEPNISELLTYMDKKQKEFLSLNHINGTPVGKYTVFPIKEFHKYCILPPLIKTTISDNNNESKELIFHLNREEYKIYLSAIGSQLTAIKYLYVQIKDENRKKILRKILENESDISISCPTYNIKLHYTKDCSSSRTILKCLDNYIRRSCQRKIETRHSVSLCEHLFFLFENIKNPYSQNFKDFLSDGRLSLVKPQSVWNVPVFKVYKPNDFKDNSKNIETGVFKMLNNKNLVFLSFNDKIPKNLYYEVEIQPLTKLSLYASKISDKLLRFFYLFKKLSSPISPVSVEELNHNIKDFNFKEAKNEVKCQNVKKSLQLELDVETMKGIVTEKICKIIESHSLAKQVHKEIPSKPLIIHDKIAKKFRIQCIVLSAFVEAYNIVRQILNLESILSLTRYTSLYLHKFFNSVTSLKGNFLYKNANALKYAAACSKAVLHVPAVLYKRNIYVAETFLSLYLGLSNLVSSNPSSPFFEFAIMEFLVTYFNKGSEKFVLYLITILSVLHLNIYYYEQIFCHFKEHFPTLKTKMIHPDIANRVLVNLKSLIGSRRYMEMFNLYKHFESDEIFNTQKVFSIIYDFQKYFESNKSKKEAKLEEISEVPIPLDTLNDGIGYREEDLLYEIDKEESIDPLLDVDLDDTESEDEIENPKNKSHFLDILSEGQDICAYSRQDKQLELILSPYIGNVRRDESLESKTSEKPEVTLKMIKERQQRLDEEMDQIEEINEPEVRASQSRTQRFSSESTSNTSESEDESSTTESEGSKKEGKKKRPKKKSCIPGLGFITSKLKCFKKK